MLMNLKSTLINSIVFLCICFSNISYAAINNDPLLDTFIKKMVAEHNFQDKSLRKLFNAVQVKQSILKAMSRPAEGGHTPWHKYRKIFLNSSRINGGVKFWQQNKSALSAVEKKYGVPAEIIVAIIGVETQYGGNTGSYKVIDALSTLAFKYPRRSAFFTSELENFLLLCREENMNPLHPKGSYAGAMGLPQFMPSSYRNFAADFEADQKRDIWKNPADAIESVANYFIQHGWQSGKDVIVQTTSIDKNYSSFITKGLEPDITLAELQTANFVIPAYLDLQTKAKLFEFEHLDGNKLWLGLDNFYTITRYNHSKLYAMAVYQLSKAISAKANIR